VIANVAVRSCSIDPEPDEGRLRRHERGAMIRISVTAAAYEAIAATLPFGSVGFEGEVTPRGERQIGLKPPVLDRLKAMRGPGESYSHVISRLATG
jgi:hypothetical protein